MNRHLVMASSIALLTLGCGVAGPEIEEGDDTDLVALDDKADAAAAIPTGTFELSQGAPGSFAELILRGDHSFHRIPLVECGNIHTCTPAIVDGTYTTYRSKSTGRTYIKFWNKSGKLMEMFSFL